MGLTVAISRVYSKFLCATMDWIIWCAWCSVC